MLNLSVTPGWREKIKFFEGFKGTAYRDAVGVWTIGYGFTRGVKPGDVMTREEADLRLEVELPPRAAAILKLCPVELLDYEMDALVDFVYNLGVNALRSSALRQKLLRGDHAAAALEFNRWVFAGGRKLPGLIIRREAERQRFLGGP